MSRRTLTRTEEALEVIDEQIRVYEALKLVLPREARLLASVVEGLFIIRDCIDPVSAVEAGRLP